MPKTPHTFKLSKQAEQDIAAIRARFPYLNDTTAVEYALRRAVADTATAARSARRTAVTKETK